MQLQKYFYQYYNHNGMFIKVIRFVYWILAQNFQDSLDKDRDETGHVWTERKMAVGLGLQKRSQTEYLWFPLALVSAVVGMGIVLVLEFTWICNQGKLILTQLSR